jgi:hypothetical protein
VQAHESKGAPSKLGLGGSFLQIEAEIPHS